MGVSWSNQIILSIVEFEHKYAIFASKYKNLQKDEHNVSKKETYWSFLHLKCDVIGSCYS